MGFVIEHFKLTTEIRTGYNEVFILEHFCNVPNEYLHTLSHYLTDIADTEDGGKIKKGFYAVFIANQNKGFVPEFNKQFKSDYLYFAKQAFILAHQLCENEWKDSFKKDFIDNYDEEKSFFIF